MVRRWWTFLAVVVSAALLVPAGAPPLRAQEAAYDWALLGPAGPTPIRTLATAPGWPSDGLILATRADALVRSRDGGRSWERLPLPGPGITALHVVAGAGWRAVLAAYGRPSQETGRAILRSTDDGTTWQQVLDASGVVAGRSGGELFVSSAGADGPVFALLDGRLSRTDDGGATWEAVEPVPGQRIQRVVFSPAFVEDRTIFLAVVSADFPGVGSIRPPADGVWPNESSAGILVSADAGRTWTAAATGLEADGAPYRHVQALAISPTFARDGTLFAAAWGPSGTVQYSNVTVYTPRAAVFRSRDRGGTWEPVAAGGQRTLLALSPTFADDGVAILAASSSFVSPASSTCRVSRSGDGGATWETVIGPSSYEGCADLRLVTGGADGLAVVFKAVGWLFSVDGGRAWKAQAPPLLGLLRSLAAAPPHAGGPPAVLFGTDTGIWAFGRGVEGTGGTLPCPAVAVGGFGRVYAENPGLKARLGCPLAPEEPVRLRVQVPELRTGTSGALALADGGQRPLVLRGAGASAIPSWSAASATTELPPDLEALDAVRQEFDGGTLYFIAPPGGERTILAVGPSAGTSGWWLRIPD